MNIFRLLHTIYTIFLFVVSVLILFPFFFLFGLSPKWHHLAYKLDHLWAIVYFPLCFFKTQIIFEGEALEDKPVIYCANHFSTIDIPSMALLPKQACYVGKESISSLPLFGYMFKTLHITVNRGSFRDRGRAYRKYKDAIEQDKSLFIFPEGGINSTNIPQQSNYKDGAFKLAIECNIPIVPVSILHNWKVLPDGDWLIKGRKIKLVVHKPIDTTSLVHADIRALKEEVRSIIQRKINLENGIKTNLE
ncbi:MAG: 1-acyl-sn-glycerol-3-phosphate acyltransferase [Cyclobacteriaceae bacterium]|nr:1-acyl-sn-glycerol-3-phosphate acyltransferase [Cyclobacteriaceae bacterium]